MVFAAVSVSSVELKRPSGPRAVKLAGRLKEVLSLKFRNAKVTTLVLLHGTVMPSATRIVTRPSISSNVPLNPKYCPASLKRAICVPSSALGTSNPSRQQMLISVGYSSSQFGCSVTDTDVSAP